MMRILPGLLLVPFLSLSAFAQAWTPKAPPPDPIGTGACVASEGGSVYLLRGGSTAHFYSYSPASDTWTSLAPLPDVAGAGARLAASGGALYAARGGDTFGFYRYDISGNTWSTLSDPPFRVEDGSGLAASGGFLFLLEGGGSPAFARFDRIAGTWTGVAPLVSGAGPGTCLVAMSDGRLLAAPGGTSTTFLYSFDAWNPGPAMPAPASAGSNLTAHADGRLYFLAGGTSDLYEGTADGGTWVEVPVDAPGLPTTNPLSVAPGEVFVMTTNTFASLPLAAAPEECDCDHGSDFGGCSAGPFTGSAIPIVAGALVLLYARRRKVAS